ncbi:hypothetical protein BASA82_000688 [Batrachochytrium salamandrivorans]|uniref:Uncharacterized protein n=1 Tax=Batrachochytrium salamandrivorans TaxID=1357716 RepID=A0ABQ8FHG9_9FUNG|nr:hypothetical protein BASA60_005551 [Batrachochytrium salamandrivorans]KAH6574867.1 hypothetical protein BASA62_002232 [Batrachochytrium salamandrivorans]KAH6583975.1 hypothetical protein BASA61_007737 [Batrachochytrium salamandrivorans]KAH6598378.1 hypothetical protein BASA50_003799 [Batrachochytrium salamandrivorans]KAH9262265.1 hypothetical protein BASA82_000688 [Batrachochytrium salamandrivorans]
MLALVAGLVLAYMAYSRLSRKRPYSGDLTKQRVVILGASSGIGKDLAIQYASRGAQLLLLARRRDQLEDVQSACRAMHAATTCEIVIGDITNEIVLSQVVQATTAVLGGIDVLVLCAGITSVRPFGSLCELDTIQSKDMPHATSISSSLIQQVFATNVYAPMMAVKHFLPILITHKSQIVVVSSVAGVIAAPTRSVYTASKHALTGFFNALRIELAYTGVSVCIVLPGTVNTDFRASAVDSDVPGTATHSAIAKVADQKRRGGISSEACAAYMIRAADRGDRLVYLPSMYFFAHWAYVVFPDLVDYFAAMKYGFSRPSV